MRRFRYLLALLPLATIWLYTLAQSSGQLRVLLGGLGAVADRSEAPAPVEIVAGEMPEREDVAPAITDSASTEVAPRDRQPPLPAIAADRNGVAGVAGVEPLYGNSSMDRSSAEPAAELHPEITDPKIRRLLEPAWAD